MDSIQLETIIQGGAVGISVLLIILIFILVQMVYKIATNHFSHNTKALEENIKMLGRISEMIETGIKSNEIVIKTCERVNERLDK
jgi:hypothetical protein